jgi:glycosyltransferase involved in cell wall biosynthesis
MKIGIDCRLWNETGVGRYIRNLVLQLQELDKKNTYVLFVQSKDYKEVISQVSSLKSQVVKTDIRWHSVEEQVKFPRILEKENLDLMHFPYFSVPIKYKRPFVITIHDLILHHFGTGKASTLPLPLYKMKHAGYKYVLSQAVKNAQKIIVPLETVRDDVLETFGISEDRVVVTTEGVDDKLEARSKKQELRDYFLYVGNAYPHKNLERLIEAFSEVLRSKKQEVRSKDLQLVLVGKEDFFYKRLRDKVDKMGLGDSVLFKHDVTDGELAGLYKNAKGLISASLMEGFGLPPLEAMALSCPVILSDIPAFREVSGNAAFYFNPYSVDAIAERMNYVYGATEKTRQDHIKKGLERVKEFSWEDMAKKTLGVYNSGSRF